MEMKDDEIMTQRQVAEMFLVDVKTVTRWANIGKLPSFRTLGGHRRFYKKDVIKAFEEANRTES
jgi:excisionase family DNA binding protein